MVKSENTNLNLILSLLPGFLALFIIGMIVNIKETKEIDLIFFGLILTLVCRALAWPFVWVWAKITGKTVLWDQTSPGFLSRMAALSIFVGIVIGIAI